MTGLPKDYDARKALPLFDFYTKYFPLAQIELVKVAVAGNDQHNPGEPLHWARGKSMDQLNTALRHMLDHGMGEVFDPGDADRGHRVMHLAKAAWRLMAEIQLLCEAAEPAPVEVAPPAPEPPTPAPEPTLKTKLAELCGIDLRLNGMYAWEAAQTWARSMPLDQPDPWLAIGRLICVPEMQTASETAWRDAFRTAWNAG